MTLRLSESMVQAIRSYGERAYPAECCGAIAGRSSPDKEAIRLFPVQNRRTDDPHRYLIAPDDFRALDKEVQEAGWEILGFYHSHPDHPAVPSAYDVAHAWPWYSYVIVRVSAGTAGDLASWVLDEERPRMHPETLVVTSEV